MPTLQERFQEWDRQFWLVPKILFFTMNLAYYSCYSFRPDYLDQTHKIKTKDYGLIAAILSLVIFAGSYFWSYLADRTGSFRNMLLICTISSAAIFQAYIFQFPKESTIAIVTVITALYIFFVSALVPLLDALVMEMLNQFPGNNKTKYGRQRMFGTLAYAVMQVSIGTVKKLSPLLNILIVALSANFVVMVLFFLPKTAKKKAPAKDVEVAKESTITVPPVAKLKNENSVSTIQVESVQTTDKISKAALPSNPVVQDTRSPFIRLMTNGNFLFLLLIAFMNGVARAMMTHFLRPIQKMVFNTPPWASGISFAVGVSLEIPVLFYSGPLLQKLGPRKMLLIAQLCMVIRICLYAFMPREFPGKEFIPLAYEPFKGLGFGFMQSAIVVWVAEIAPKELKSTAQSLYSGVFSGLSAFVSGMIGYLVQSIGIKHNYPNPTKAQQELMDKEEIARSSFLLCLTAYFSIFALAVFFVKYILIDGMRAKKSGKEDTNFVTQ